MSPSCPRVQCPPPSPSFADATPFDGLCATTDALERLVTGFLSHDVRTPAGVAPFVSWLVQLPEREVMLPYLQREVHSVLQRVARLPLHQHTPVLRQGGGGRKHLFLARPAPKPFHTIHAVM